MLIYWRKPIVDNFDFNGGGLLILTVSIHLSTELAPGDGRDSNYGIYINGFYSGGRHVTFAGEEMTYFNWFPGKSNTIVGQYIKLRDKVDTRWEQSDGVLRRYFICEKTQ